MKYKSRTEQRKVTETLSAILLPLVDHLNDADADAVRKALEILNNTDIEAEYYEIKGIWNAKFKSESEKT